jgi:hypothetical protein
VTLEGRLARMEQLAYQQRRMLDQIRQRLVAECGCSDCGAPAGRECYPEYGCDWLRTRTVRPIYRA